MSVDNYTWATTILAKRYPGWSGIDDILAEAIRTHFPAGGFVLDVGCGKSSPVAQYKSRARFTVGTDIDRSEIEGNHDFHALVASDGAKLPFAGNTFDLLLSKTAIEHMEEPEQFFAGVHRVLKPGGVFIWATSNLRSLPILVSRFTPLGVHRWVYRRLFGKSLHIEQFPTRYRANTERVVNRQLAAAGFEKLALRRASWPMYFAFSRPLFRAMLPVHRWSDRVGSQLLQVHLIGVYRKQ
jgi:ubiquinone/menaquinone biosynthesis C-methylase UbiE